MGAIRYIPKHTFQEFLTWQGRWELYDGLAVNMSPKANPKHQKIASRMDILLGIALARQGYKFEALNPIDIKINDFTAYNPDVLILCEDIEDQYLATPPPLVVEVVSPSSREKDKVIKHQAYQEFGIKYYIIVDHEYAEVFAYELIDGIYKLKSDSNFELPDGCEFSLDLSSVIK